MYKRILLVVFSLFILGFCFVWNELYSKELMELLPSDTYQIQEQIV